MVIEASMAPVVLFVYNRPWHTERSLNALASNSLFNKSILYIYADGPKEEATNTELNAIYKVRKLIRSKKWCDNLFIRESEINLGLAHSIVKGVTEVVNKHGKVIVLEDDIVTSSGFLKYMNDALEVYKHDNRVFQISGFMVPTKFKLDSTGFYRAPASWGWATWARAWEHFCFNSEKLYKKINKLNVYYFNIDGTYNYLEQLEMNLNGDLETWAVKWYASLLLKNGICLFPCKSLVRNIGFDGTGIHSGHDRYKHRLLSKIKTAQNIEVRPIDIRESKKYLQAFKCYYIEQQHRWGHIHLHKRIIKRIFRIAKYLNVFLLFLVFCYVSSVDENCLSNIMIS
jgi:hypothetical protein